MTDHRSWTSISDNPVATEVDAYLHASLLKRQGFKRDSVLSSLVNHAAGKDVLDIGFVEHSLEFMSKPGWKHAKIRAVAKSCLGVDISSAGVEAARALGYESLVVDATSGIDLGRRFDLAVIGDVIEHVNDPQALLSFAARHIRLTGKVVVTTPNPFFFANTLRVIRVGVFVANAEHVCWITPSNALELARRSKLALTRYSVLAGNKLSATPVLWHSVGHLFRWRPELFGSAYEYEFGLPDDQKEAG